MNGKIIQFLFTLRVQKGKWVYMVAFLLLLLFALAGLEYGAFFLYFPLAALCFIQYFYPTMICWIILFCLYLSGAALYIYGFFRDLLGLLAGAKDVTSIFVNPIDSTVFTILTGLIVAIAFGLYKIRPKGYAVDVSA